VRTLLNHENTKVRKRDNRNIVQFRQFQHSAQEDEKYNQQYSGKRKNVDEALFEIDY
jgi:hypothetical protein